MRFRRLFHFYLLIVTMLYGCSSQSGTKSATRLKAGLWRAVIQSPGGDLPFGLEIQPNSDSVTYTVFALNGNEKLRLDTALVTADSVRIPMSLFDSEIVARIGDSTLTGTYTKRGVSTLTQMNFRAVHGQRHRFFADAGTPAANVSGKWSVTFVGKQDTTQAVGVFSQEGTKLTGTFLTTTGDYRYLAGDVRGDTMYLSCFDGTHVYLFRARVDASGQQLSQGGFWSGTASYESWTAQKNEQAALPDLNTLTYLKKGYDRIDFTFPDPDGKPVSLADERYKGKVVVVQVLGSWCPNCMDETNFLSPWYRKNRDRGVEVIGLAYEKSPELAVSGPKLKKMKSRFGVEYEVLLAGENDKEKASRTLPMLNRILGFPTTIVIDKQGKVRQIHTGFSGPGTGEYYTRFVEDFERLIDKLLQEPV